MIGLTLAKAKTKLTRGHCRAGTITRKASSLRKKGKVIVQAPRAGKKLKNGARVNLVVGRGPTR